MWRSWWLRMKINASKSIIWSPKNKSAKSISPVWENLLCSTSKPLLSSTSKALMIQPSASHPNKTCTLLNSTNNSSIKTDNLTPSYWWNNNYVSRTKPFIYNESHSFRTELLIWESIFTTSKRVSRQLFPDSKSTRNGAKNPFHKKSKIPKVWGSWQTKC